MNRKNRAEYQQLRDSGKSLQDIADMFGVSRQRVHEVLAERSKRERVTDLKATIEAQHAEIERLRGLCGEAADGINRLANEPHLRRLAFKYFVDRLRAAASEGGQS